MSRYETVRTDRVLSEGQGKLADDPGYGARILALCITTNERIRVRFASGTNIRATFYASPEGPLVLPYNEEGWWTFENGEDINYDMTGTAAARAAVLVVWIREE